MSVPAPGAGVTTAVAPHVRPIVIEGVTVRLMDVSTSAARTAAGNGRSSSDSSVTAARRPDRRTWTGPPHRRARWTTAPAGRGSIRAYLGRVNPVNGPV